MGQRSAMMTASLDKIPLRVVSILEPPFLMLEGEGLAGNNRFRGYIKDLLEKVSQYLDRPYTLYLGEWKVVFLSSVSPSHLFTTDLAYFGCQWQRKFWLLSYVPSNDCYFFRCSSFISMFIWGLKPGDGWWNPRFVRKKPSLGWKSPLFSQGCYQTLPWLLILIFFIQAVQNPAL